MKRKYKTRAAMIANLRQLEWHYAVDMRQRWHGESHAEAVDYVRTHRPQLHQEAMAAVFSRDK